VAITAAPTTSEHDSPALGPGKTAAGPTPDAVEVALADALSRASVAGEWAMVGQLARELEARRKAHEASNVVRIHHATRKQR
jgi:hypothetical protein